MVLRIDRHDDTGRGRRLIELALCNDRETPRKIPVNAWLYQTKLSVSAEDAAVFLPVTDALEDTRPERDDELRLKLQYRDRDRDRLEFAIGRTCSVDWKVATDARRASEVYTTWLPTRTSTPPRASGNGARFGRPSNPCPRRRRTRTTRSSPRRCSRSASTSPGSG
ncbi:MAG: hypothetical protein ACRDTJ_20185 [Pseudonocardiaceae bacterium]